MSVAQIVFIHYCLHLICLIYLILPFLCKDSDCKVASEGISNYFLMKHSRQQYVSTTTEDQIWYAIFSVSVSTQTLYMGYNTIRLEIKCCALVSTDIYYQCTWNKLTIQYHIKS